MINLKNSSEKNSDSLNKSVRLVLHVHTKYSDCATNKISEIINLCQSEKIDIIAITDHNTIAGALELQKIAPKWLKVMIGEEISTKDGEVIGLFLKNEISGKGKSIEDVILEIKSQNGIVMIPHPFDIIRKGINNEKKLLELAENIDLFETYNARCFPIFNRKAEKFLNKLQAKNKNIIGCSGSDAHYIPEIVNAVTIIRNFKDSTEFLDSLNKSKVIIKLNYLVSFYFVKSVIKKYLKR